MNAKELTAKLGVDARKLRRILRKQYGTLKVQGAGKRWEITDEQATYATEQIQGKPVVAA